MQLIFFCVTFVSYMNMDSQWWMESIDTQYATYLPLIAHWADWAWAGHGLGISYNKQPFWFWYLDSKWRMESIDTQHATWFSPKPKVAHWAYWAYWAHWAGRYGLIGPTINTSFYLHYGLISFNKASMDWIFFFYPYITTVYWALTHRPSNKPNPKIKLCPILCHHSYYLGYPWKPPN